MDKSEDQVADGQQTGQGVSAARRMDIGAIYPTEFTEGVSANIDPEDAKALWEAEQAVPKRRRRLGAMSWIFLGVVVFSVVMLVGWAPLNDGVLHVPFDFGPLTAACTLLLTIFVLSLASLLRRVMVAAAKNQRFSATYYIFIPLAALVLFGAAGFFEYKHQYIQAFLTPSVRKVSGVPQAVVRCDRVMANLFGATRYGYVSYSNRNIAHLHPSACREIWDWVAQGKTGTTALQMHSLDTVTHEAMHVGGMDSELGATCGSFEWLEDVLVDLGASRAEAKRVAATQSSRHENYHGSTPQQKQYEGDCSQVPSVR